MNIVTIINVEHHYFYYVYQDVNVKEPVDYFNYF